MSRGQPPSLLAALTAELFSECCLKITPWYHVHFSDERGIPLSLCGSPWGLCVSKEDGWGRGGGGPGSARWVQLRAVWDNGHLLVLWRSRL